MVRRFEQASGVRSLAFHPERPWLLVGTTGETVVVEVPAEKALTRLGPAEQASPAAAVAQGRPRPGARISATGLMFSSGRTAAAV